MFGNIRDVEVHQRLTDFLNGLALDKKSGGLPAMNSEIVVFRTLRMGIDVNRLKPLRLQLAQILHLRVERHDGVARVGNQDDLRSRFPVDVLHLLHRIIERLHRIGRPAGHRPTV